MSNVHRNTACSPIGFKERSLLSRSRFRTDRRAKNRLEEQHGVQHRHLQVTRRSRPGNIFGMGEDSNSDLPVFEID